jgi:hypothetical protein
MKKYDVIERAQQAGSNAKTKAGAIRFLIAAAKNNTPLYHRGVKPARWHRKRAEWDNRELSRRAERAAKNLGVWALDVAERLAQIFFEKMIDKTYPLKTSQSSWAGGNHSTTWEIADAPGCFGGSTKAWSRNGKWSGSNSYATLQFTTRALSYFPTGHTRDGAIVLDAEPVEKNVFKIVCPVQARGFDLKMADYWLIKGFHSSKKSLTAAKKEVAEARKKSIAALLRKRTQKINAKHVWVSIDDSLAAGNCQFQTTAFARNVFEKIGGEVGAIRGDFLLELRNDIYALRALGAAQKRYQVAV